MVLLRGTLGLLAESLGTESDQHLEMVHSQTKGPFPTLSISLSYFIWQILEAGSFGDFFSPLPGLTLFPDFSKILILSHKFPGVHTSWAVAVNIPNPQKGYSGFPVLILLSWGLIATLSSSSLPGQQLAGWADVEATVWPTAAVTLTPLIGREFEEAPTLS